MEFSTDIRAQENAENNLRKKEAKQNAEESLGSEEVRANLRRTIDDGGSIGRRLERELQRTQSTGRISNWLAGQTAKAEANVGRQRQQTSSEFISSVSATIESPVAAPFGGLFKYKPEVPDTGEQKRTCFGLALYLRNNNVWIDSGTIAGIRPQGVNPPNGMFIASSGRGYVWARVSVNDSNGSITSRSIGVGTSTPDDSGSNYYYTLGYFEYNRNRVSISNFGCGSVAVLTCRNWFTTVAPLYRVIFSR